MDNIALFYDFYRCGIMMTLSNKKRRIRDWKSGILSSEKKVIEHLPVIGIWFWKLRVYGELKKMYRLNDDMKAADEKFKDLDVDWREYDTKQRAIEMSERLREWQEIEESPGKYIVRDTRHEVGRAVAEKLGEAGKRGAAAGEKCRKQFLSNME